LKNLVELKTGLTLPAVIRVNKVKSWYIDGRLHRIDGPAIEYANGETRYWINGNHIPQLDNKCIYGKEKLEKLLVLL
jgi:hypothetical protein